MAFPCKHVLLVGATSGIGRAMANRLIQAGIKVTVVGRRKQRLEEFVEKHGEEKASAMNYDGTQRKYDLTDPKDGDLSDFRAEMDVNFISYVTLTQEFTPFLLSNTTSLLALVPAPRIPAYSAAKAALNAFLYCLREQLRE
ncbi:Glucose/ribitol dehydrogenase [Penicillium cf. viridicatum]|uniref:Glucose/ribitol dehydrogenase n=1 Tax=Penicillium cf. viridicatum TaxID=2972119 RepID=A0A9W9MB51_9EURO|nr:Glucose/ribitol dehydrogenase [Penicillium cf. viridicatum]